MTEFDAFIWKMAYRYRWACTGPLTQEDLVQVGRMAFVQAKASHDPTRGPFAPHATIVIQQRMLKVAQEDSGPVRLPEKAHKRGHAVFSAKLGPETTEGRQEASTDQAKALAALGTLSPRKQKVVRMRMRETLYEDIGASLGVSHVRARQIHEEALAELRELLTVAV